MNWTIYEQKYDFKKDDIESSWKGHELFVYDLIRNTKPETIVELGTHNGYSFFVMCQAVKDSGLKTKLYAIDSWEGDDHANHYGNEVYKFVKKLKAQHYKTINANLIKKYFDEAVADFRDNSIDILHIDGLHTYQAVKNDFETWLPKMKKDGILLFHDTSATRQGFGVYKLWEEIQKSYNTTCFKHSYGLGVVPLSGKEVIKEKEHNYYQLNGYKAFVEVLNNTISRCEEENKRKEKWIHHLETDIKELNKCISEMKKSKAWKFRELTIRVKGYPWQKR